MKDKTYKYIKKAGELFIQNPTIHLPNDFDNNNPAIFMANHEGFFGPTIVTLKFPVEFRPWCHSGVVFHEESHNYIMSTFPKKLPNINPKISRLIAKIIAKPVVNIINKTNPIPAFHDYKRSIQSIRLGIKSLENNENQLIFSNTPMIKNGEYNPNFNFMQGYLIVVKKAMKQGIIPKIYPVSINKRKKSISIGNPITPNPNTNWLYEKKRIHNYIVNEVQTGYENPARKFKEILTSVKQF